MGFKLTVVDPQGVFFIEHFPVCCARLRNVMPCDVFLIGIEHGSTVNYNFF